VGIPSHPLPTLPQDTQESRQPKRVDLHNIARLQATKLSRAPRRDDKFVIRLQKW
jgi:hypothetical protein